MYRARYLSYNLILHSELEKNLEGKTSNRLTAKNITKERLTSCKSVGTIWSFLNETAYQELSRCMKFSVCPFSIFCMSIFDFLYVHFRFSVCPFLIFYVNFQFSMSIFSFPCQLSIYQFFNHLQWLVINSSK